jgi:hypothetical protein
VRKNHTLNRKNTTIEQELEHAKRRVEEAERNMKESQDEEKAYWMNEAKKWNENVRELGLHKASALRGNDFVIRRLGRRVERHKHELCVIDLSVLISFIRWTDVWRRGLPIPVYEYPFISLTLSLILYFH